HAGTPRGVGGKKYTKNSVLVEAYGTVDELNASIGLARATNEEGSRAVDTARRLEQDLRWVKNKLFDIGGILATAPGQTFKNMPMIKAQDAVRLERMIDRCQKDLAPLKEFILPGGGRVSA